MLGMGWPEKAMAARGGQRRSVRVEALWGGGYVEGGDISRFKLPRPRRRTLAPPR